MKKTPLNKNTSGLNGGNKMKRSPEIKAASYRLAYGEGGRRAGKTCLQEYFLHHFKVCERCDETGLEINEPGYSNICHILPKEKYKSVMCDVDNAFYLKDLNDHGRFDYLLGGMMFEKIEEEFPNAWPKVLLKLEKVLPRIKESGKLSNKLKQYIYES